MYVTHFALDLATAQLTALAFPMHPKQLGMPDIANVPKSIKGYNHAPNMNSKEATHLEGLKWNGAVLATSPAMEISAQARKFS